MYREKERGKRLGSGVNRFIRRPYDIYIIFGAGGGSGFGRDGGNEPNIEKRSLRLLYWRWFSNKCVDCSRERVNGVSSLMDLDCCSVL